jgi:hypothetical protein
MYFELSINIKCSQEKVFIFLRDKDKHVQKKDSPVLLLERITEDPVGVGTKYREIVQMLFFYKSEIISTITRYEPYECLEEEFFATGMRGYLSYQFLDKNGSTELIQKENIVFTFPFNLLNPIIKKVLQRKLVERLKEIKSELES